MTRVRGYLNPLYFPPAPFVEGILFSDNLNLHHPLDLLIDSGASATILLDKDVEALGIEVDRLEKHEKDIGGIGGTIKTHSINDAELVFEREDGTLYKERLNILVGTHEPLKLDEMTRQKIMMMPSLLGRDVINKFRFVYDAPKRELYLEG